MLPLHVVTDRDTADPAGLLFPLGLFLGVLGLEVLKSRVKTVPCFLNLVPEDLLRIQGLVKCCARFIELGEAGFLGLIDLCQCFLHGLCQRTVFIRCVAVSAGSLASHCVVFRINPLFQVRYLRIKCLNPAPGFI